MKGSNHKRNILIAIGNSGRQDDGLGWAFADVVREKGLFPGDVEYRYQPQVEDAELISRYDRVVWVDASREAESAPFTWDRCRSAGDFHFTTHEASPSTVLYLSEQLYDCKPEAWVMGIKGYTWELEEGLSDEAKENLENALLFFKNHVQVIQ